MKARWDALDRRVRQALLVHVGYRETQVLQAHRDLQDELEMKCQRCISVKFAERFFSLNCLSFCKATNKVVALHATATLDLLVHQAQWGHRDLEVFQALVAQGDIQGTLDGRDVQVSMVLKENQDL